MSTDDTLTMEKTYQPAETEQAIYDEWESKGYFHEEPDPARPPFCMVIPPPNITGQLHMGHALNNTIQDAIARFKRMQGYCTLWLPGTDHASIATEVKIIEQLASEGLTKQDLGREQFLQRAWAWRKQYGGRIVQQLKKLGSSCDWQRERFTMDQGCNKAVTEVFVRLYEKGLIYRGNRIIQWCPECRTALSDAEVEYQEQASKLWHLRYPLTDGSGEIIVATTRPETMLGDTAVAVHPDDECYRDMVGKTVHLPLVNRDIPIVADAYVEKEFGSGAVKVTPAHDPNDYEIALRHDLPMITIMDISGVLNEHAGAFQGLKGETARKAVVKALMAEGALLREEDYTHNVGSCYRCKTTVEPLISRQWFVSMKPLAKPAIESVQNGDIEFVPERYARTYFHWMENIRDWCISRQLWWGHRIPAWYCQDCGETMVAHAAPTACTKCGSVKLIQDEDVLDTWFSSALWPFSTLGWPEKTEELKYFYPTNVLVTAYDIIFFWVARMIFSGLEFMGEKPFSQVLMHGIVRDAEGRKMSKSLGNGIDPLEIIEKYGADALRFALTTGISPGNDMRYYDEKVEAARNFANKIWNASRFVLMNLGDDPIPAIDPARLEAADRWILSRLARAVEEVTKHMDAFELGLASQKVYEFIWSELCDWYIEMAKSRLYEHKDTVVRSVLLHVLSASLQLLHPFMPFVTEKIWSSLPGREGSIMMSRWPESASMLRFEQDEACMDRLMEIIRAVRNIRSEMKVPMGRKNRILLIPMADMAAFFKDNAFYMERLAYASEVVLVKEKCDIPEGAVSAVCEGAEVYLPLGDLVDLAAEQQRLIKERDRLVADMERLSTKLSQEGFISKAPPLVVEKERENLRKQQEKLEKMDQQIEYLAGLKG